MKNFILLNCLLLVFSFFFSCGKKQEQQSSLDSNKNQLQTTAVDSSKNIPAYNFEGEYYYQFKDEKNKVVKYELILNKQQNKYTGTFNIRGYLIKLPMVCYANIEGGKLKIFFDKFFDNPGKNELKKDDLLAELEFNGTDLITYWHKAVISDSGKPGVAALKKVPPQSFTFLNREVVFGITPEAFTDTYPEFKVNNELKTDKETGYSLTKALADCEIKYDVLFGIEGLKQFKLTSNCNSEEKDKKYIDEILKQFKYKPNKNIDEEEMGDVMEDYRKDKLTASAFIGGFYMLTINRSEK